MGHPVVIVLIFKGKRLYLWSRAAVPLGLRPRGREVADVEVDVGRADLEAVRGGGSFCS